MKVLYYLRVFFISFEFMFILLSFLAFIFIGKYTLPYINLIKPESDALKWIITYPIMITGWIFTEGVAVLFPDEKTSAFLHKWKYFWKLKAHFNIGLFYCLIFLLPCIVIWLINKVNSYYGFWIFITCSAAITINAFSFFSAKIHLKSVLLNLKQD